MAFSESCYSGTSGSFGVSAEKEEKKQPPTVEALDSYALERWEVSSNPSSASNKRAYMLSHRRFYTIWFLLAPVRRRRNPRKASCIFSNVVV